MSDIRGGDTANWTGARYDDATIFPDGMNPDEFDLVYQPVQDCPADLNGDDVVDGADLVALISEWGGNSENADLTGDGMVDGRDLTALIAAWGNPCEG